MTPDVTGRWRTPDRRVLRAYAFGDATAARSPTALIACGALLPALAYPPFAPAPAKPLGHGWRVFADDRRRNGLRPQSRRTTPWRRRRQTWPLHCATPAPHT